MVADRGAGDSREDVVIQVNRRTVTIGTAPGDKLGFHTRLHDAGYCERRYKLNGWLNTRRMRKTIKAGETEMAVEIAKLRTSPTIDRQIRIMMESR